jgi:hypothetical protein
MMERKSQNRYTTRTFPNLYTQQSAMISPISVEITEASHLLVFIVRFHSCCVCSVKSGNNVFEIIFGSDST